MFPSDFIAIYSGFADSNDRSLLGVSLIMHDLQSEEVQFPMPYTATAF